MKMTMRTKRNLYEPIKPGTLTRKYALHWLKVHEPHVRRFIHSRYILGTMSDFKELAKYDPSLAVEIVYDSIVPNEVKKRWIIDFLLKSRNIVMVLGDKGEGKNALSFLLLEWFYDNGVLPVIVGPPQSKPDEFGRVFDIFDSKPGTVLFLDELGMLYNARSSGKGDQKDDVSIFNVIRHHEKSAVINTQLSALGDVNFLRLSDMVVLKPMSLFGMHLERDVITKAVPDDFMPQDKTVAHFFCKEFRCNVRVPLSRFWSEDYSVPFSQVSEDEVLDYIQLLYQDGLDPDDIVEQLKRRSYRTDKKEVTNRLSECGYDVKG